ncbi:GAF domain-containing protein [Thermomonas sp.]|uniref:GAF domain-containing protein n=1 Tax=Thermomonas sp. TaxID=1971895 RepID=UPI0035B2BAC5
MMIDALVPDRLRYLLQSLQINEALRELNATTGYRFTAVYRFTATGAANLAIFDRESDAPEALLVVPEGASYCGIVRESKNAFLVTRSLEDGRIVRHPAREAVQSYCGVPLIGDDGVVFGSLCHFDFEPRIVSDDVTELMSEVSRYLSPESGMDELAETVAQRITRLSLMADVIRDAARDPDEMRETFNIYAQPVRLQAEALRPPVRAAMEQRLSALLESILAPAHPA